MDQRDLAGSPAPGRLGGQQVQGQIGRVDSGDRPSCPGREQGTARRPAGQLQHRAWRQRHRQRPLASPGSSSGMPQYMPDAGFRVGRDALKIARTGP
jgi:hypothetical protein